MRERARVVRQWVKDNIDLFNCTRRLPPYIYIRIYTASASLLRSLTLEDPTYVIHTRDQMVPRFYHRSWGCKG
jgi:hypothetical protein